jgi:TnpA family transposase
MLQEMSQWCVREDTLKAANALLVNYLHSLPLSAVWGDGTVSSSDGQRFGLQASSLLGSLYPRYFGYYDRAVTVYKGSGHDCVKIYAKAESLLL